MRTQDYIRTLAPREQDYARAVLAHIREQASVGPWHPDYGLPTKRAETIRRRIGTLAL